MDNNIKSRIKEIENKLESLEQKHSDEIVTKKSKLGAEKVLAELVAGIAFGLFLGFYLDDYFNTKPLFILSLIILGLAGSFYNIYKEAVKEDINKENK